MKRSSRFPGWKMSWDQHNAYFWHLSNVYAALGLTTKEAREDMRQTIHFRAFGRPVSAKEIDHLTMFDAFKAECLALLQPDNMQAQLRIAQMPLIRLRHGILEKFSPDRIEGLLRSARFKVQSLDDLKTEKDLTDFRNTLCARTAGEVEVPVGAGPGDKDEDPF